MAATIFSGGDYTANESVDAALAIMVEVDKHVAPSAGGGWYAERGAQSDDLKTYMRKYEALKPTAQRFDDAGPSKL